MDAILKRAIAASNRGQHRSAIKLLLPMARRHPRSATAAGLLGRAFFELENPRAAADWFGRAAHLSPTSELASLGFFHSLWDLGQRQQAFTEMQRFLRTADSDEYRRLLHELVIEDKLQPRSRPATTG